MPSGFGKKSTGSAVVWNLDATDEEVIKESIGRFQDTYLVVNELESVRKHDRRKRVDGSHYAPGGKYRSVLKVHVKFDKTDKHWFAGTGWLLKDDLVVTAGHLAYDHKSKRRAVSLNTYAGYHGLGSVGNKDVEKRPGDRVAILEAYHCDDPTHTYDVAFVKLKKPFENAQPFTHCDTPEEGDYSLGIVGYPGDKDDNGDDRDVGPFMYEEFAKTEWDLHKSDLHLLQYPISTFGGQSGAPVICVEMSHRIIGTHIKGFKGGMPQLNHASPIGGQYGNPYNALAEAIDEKSMSTSISLWMVNLPSPGPTTQVHSLAPRTPEKERVYAVLKKYHILFLVDDSDSMMDDGPELGSKWDMVKSEMGETASVAFENGSDGIEVQFFNFFIKPDQRARFKDLKSVEQVMRLFTDIRPDGPSHTADKLEEVLSQYLIDFQNDRQTKGLNIIVFTDGDPSPGQDVEGVIVKYAKELAMLRVPSWKVGIQFVQIGNDPKAAAFLQGLDDNLKEKYRLDRDMVDTVPWIEGSRKALRKKIILGGIIRRYDDDDTQLR